MRLQCHLSNLLTGASESTVGHQPALDEVMMACNDLLELLQGRPLDCSEPLIPAGRSQGYPCDGDQRGALDPLKMDYIAVLQVATTYAYALQLLDLAADNLQTRAGNLALVSLDMFNLGPQPATSTSVGAYMISSMVYQLRDAINLLTPEQKGLEASAQIPPPHAYPTGDSKAATTPNSIHTAVRMISEKETSLLERLSQVLNAR